MEIIKDKNINKNGNISKNIFLEKYNRNNDKFKNKNLNNSYSKSNSIKNKLIFLIIISFFYNSNLTKDMSNDYNNIKNYMNLVLNGTNILSFKRSKNINSYTCL